MLKNQSVATIEAPEFINVEPQNDMISQCEIKVLYLGENRNRSYIDRETAIKMANSLPGMPIVAAYLENKEDFGDHGHVVTIEDGEIKFTCKTQPYGFVAPNAKIWFQKFIDTDEFNCQVEREYLMTTGYLWTGQYPEIQKAIDEGLPQSMELDEATLDGHWATNHNSGVEFFIINDATFTKLCILGSDVEPCFEGASVTAPEISKDFTMDTENINKTFYTMMKQLQYALQNEGGSDMPKDNEVVEEVKEEFTAETPETEAPEAEAEFVENAGEAEEEVVEFTTTEGDADTEGTEEYVAKNKEEDESSEDDATEDTDPADDSEEDDDKKKPSNEHSLEEVEAEFAAVKAELEDTKNLLDAANAELESLRAFKLEIDNQQKEKEIAKFSMYLNDDVVAEISEHKSDYTLDELKSKLSVAYVENNVNFSALEEETDDNDNDNEEVITTFSLDSAVDMTAVPEIVKALRAVK